MRSSRRLAFHVLIALTASTLQAQTILFVDDDAPDEGDGSSWTTAFNDLQDALAAAQPEDEIWVAAGTYMPDRGTGDRTLSFELKSGVGVYGGFGGNETKRDQRDPATHETVLSGDLNGDDGPDFTNNADNSFTVVICDEIDETAILDGFTITGGNSSGFFVPADRGGGIYVRNGSPTIAGCILTGNRTDSEGGAIFNDEGSPTIINCTLHANSATLGDGVFNNGGRAMFTACTISGGATALSGSGMYNLNSSPTLVDCLFIENRAGRGGGMYNLDSTPTLTRCLFRRNLARGGGMYNLNSTPTLVNCVFEGNTSILSAGAMYNLSSSPLIVNCTFSRNSAGAGGAMYNEFSGSRPSVFGCTFSGNGADVLGGALLNQGGAAPPSLTALSPGITPRPEAVLTIRERASPHSCSASFGTTVPTKSAGQQK